MVSRQGDSPWVQTTGFRRAASIANPQPRHHFFFFLIFNNLNICFRKGTFFLGLGESQRYPGVGVAVGGRGREAGGHGRG